MGQDRRTLTEYESQYKDLKSTLTAARRSSQELAELKTALEEQQKRVLALNKEIEGGIKASTDPESMERLLEEFSKYWENIGLHEVQKVFQSAGFSHEASAGVRPEPGRRAGAQGDDL
ncbi:hypothetical protein ACFSQ7_13530 [Paenibacillus rhizoplanae]